MARRSLSPSGLLAARAQVDVVDDRLVHLVRIDAIAPSPRNPRHRMDGLAELAESLRDHGLLQPIVVRRHGSGYELIAGHRRYEAAKRLGWTDIAAAVRDETDGRAYILTLVENLQREDLQPQEEAAALLELERQLGSAQAVATAIKRSEAYVSKRKRVYQDVVLAAAVVGAGLPVTTAEELLPVKNAQQRQVLAETALREHWDAPRTRRAVRSNDHAQGRRGSSGEAATPTGKTHAGFDSKSGGCQAVTQANGTGLTFESKPGDRDRAVLCHAIELRRLLDAGPLDELTPEATAAVAALSHHVRTLT